MPASCFLPKGDSAGSHRAWRGYRLRVGKTWALEPAAPGGPVLPGALVRPDRVASGGKRRPLRPCWSPDSRFPDAHVNDTAGQRGREPPLSRCRTGRDVIIPLSSSGAHEAVPGPGTVTPAWLGVLPANCRGAGREPSLLAALTRRPGPAVRRSARLQALTGFRSVNAMGSERKPGDCVSPAHLAQGGPVRWHQLARDGGAADAGPSVLPAGGRAPTHRCGLRLWHTSSNCGLRAMTVG